jgi:glycosyltransferase involved in cell wall biosynthesis
MIRTGCPLFCKPSSRAKEVGLPEQVSVIIPAYNAAEYLAQAVESIRAQNHSPMEIIIVDDGSIDATAGVARNIPDVHFIRQDNGGPGAARNTGIREAQGDMLGFLDADDLWAAGKLAAQLDVLRRFPDIHLAAGHVEEFVSGSAPSIAGNPAPRDHGRRAYTIGALLVRRDDFFKVGWFDPALRFGEFIDWLSRAKAVGLCEYVLDQIVLYRRIHSNNTTRLAQDHQRHYLQTLRRHLERRRAAPSDREGTES